MFRRRKPKSKWRKLREAFWPSMGWKRLGRYYRHRIGRLPGTPEQIAAGFAAGIAVSFTPFVGFHLLIGGVICFLTGTSLFAMVLGTVAGGNPWTFPLIWIGTFKLGNVLLGKAASAMPVSLESFTFAQIMKDPLELLLPMMVGSVPLGLVFWFLCFEGVRRLVRGYRGQSRTRN